MMQQRRPQHVIDFLERASPAERERFFADEMTEQLKLQARANGGYSQGVGYVEGSEYCNLDVLPPNRPNNSR